jgi:hypothetical protein
MAAADRAGTAGMGLVSRAGEAKVRVTGQGIAASADERAQPEAKVGARRGQDGRVATTGEGKEARPADAPREAGAPDDQGVRGAPTATGIRPTADARNRAPGPLAARATSPVAARAPAASGSARRAASRARGADNPEPGAGGARLLAAPTGGTAPTPVAARAMGEGRLAGTAKDGAIGHRARPGGVVQVVVGTAGGHGAVIGVTAIR